MITTLMAAVVASHMAVELRWEPPAIYDPPMSQWEDRCVKPEDAVLIRLEEPVQYEVTATNSMGDVVAVIVDASSEPGAKIEVPMYTEPTKTTLWVVAIYPEEPLFSEPSCKIEIDVPAFRPAPQGFRVISMEAVVPELATPLAITLSWGSKVAAP